MATYVLSSASSSCVLHPWRRGGRAGAGVEATGGWPSRLSCQHHDLLKASVCSITSSASVSASCSTERRPSEADTTISSVLSRIPGAALVASAAVALVVSSSFGMASAVEGAFQQYFGTAASASSYGGYGGNASKRDTAEYVYDVPQGWKERQISKVEKGTNGTDSEFYNPRRKDEKVYVTYLAGFRRLAPRDNVLNNLALSDVSLQDIIASADNIRAVDKTDTRSGQLYYEYEIDSPVSHSLILVTCAKNKLYAHFVNAPSQLWSKDEMMLRHIHESFTTVGDTPVESVL